MITSSVFAALLTIAHPGNPVAPVDQPTWADAPIQAQYRPHLPHLPTLPRLPRIPKPVVPGYP